ncbi:MAG: MBL fold metallo-hydrolase [Chloroflexi bacterium]|nr:MBL fold metallo-hydrolase [Chloroflexota bacterium]
MRLSFLGGADQVGASSLLLETSNRRILIDAGITPSPKARWGLTGDQLPHLELVEQATELGSVATLDAILVTHAHTDHTGALELVVGKYRDCPVYATPPTIALTRVLHQDARRIMQSRLDEEGELPLFDNVAVQQLLDAFTPTPFRTRVPLGDDLAFTFYPSGHIAGAAMIALESSEGRVLVSGDVSISSQRTVPPPSPPPFRPDVLVLESTYGGRLHANRAVQERQLVERVAQVVGNGGKVLIPAFALGRAQEILLILDAFRRAGELPTVPVWADGMVRAVCSAYAQFPETLPLAMQERGARFFNEFIKPVESAAQRNALLWDNAPAIIVSSSGMLAGGPALTYASAFAGKPEHAILLTGYQDEESPGRRLQDMAREGRGSLKLGKRVVDVQCQLGAYSLSAHADEAQLVSLTETLDPTEVFLVHGDGDARASLHKALTARGRRVSLPYAGQAFAFRYAPALGAKRATGIGRGRALETRVLWQEFTPGGNYHTLNELARVWWGDEKFVENVRAALEQDDTYFVFDAARNLARARTQQQIELSAKRAQQLAEWNVQPGTLVIWRDAENEFQIARVTEVRDEHFWIESDAKAHTPEEVVETISAAPGMEIKEIEEIREMLAAHLTPTLPRPLDEWLAALPQTFARDETTRVALALALLHAGAERTPNGYGWRGAALEPVEPNQALALARRAFPEDARLRRVGYRLETHTLVLTFDFPDAARTRFNETFAQVERETRWNIELDPEANQGALNALARAVLPQVEIAKGPSVYREEKRVAVTVRGAAEDLDAAQEKFFATSGYRLNVQHAEGETRITNEFVTTGAPLEINAAYQILRQELAGSTLYRSSLKGNQIVLSFISPQVGARYAEKIAQLERVVGYALVVNPQPNQNAIVQAAQQLAVQAGLTLTGNPSIRTDRAQVTLALTNEIDDATRDALAQEFERQTGYQLVIATATKTDAAPARAKVLEEVVEIPVARIRLSAYQRTLTLDAEKQRKATGQLRSPGRASKPIRVRRGREGYILLDGLYRLRAAQELGWETIAAVVEN